MNNSPLTDHTQENNDGFGLRTALVAIVISLFLLGSSMYIALKLGALPWPIIFSVMLSAGILKVLQPNRRIRIHEVNVAQAGASIGGLVAAGVVFTLPGILYLRSTGGPAVEWPSPYLLALQIAIAGLLGILLSIPLKKAFIDDEQLPYPSGTAGAELLRSGAGGGRELRLMLTVAAIAALFALSRDNFFASGFSVTALTGVGIFLTLLPLPLAVGSGYILGPPASYSWFSGAVLGWLLLVPLLAANGTEATTAISMTQNAGMGIVMGAGSGFFVMYVLPRLRRMLAGIAGAQRIYLKIIPLAAVGSALGLMAGGVPIAAALLSVIAVFAMIVIAARMTGETNINPLEQFAIFAVIAINLLMQLFGQKVSASALFMMAAFIAVACAVAGDAGQDYKSAVILKTRFSDIIRVDLITVVVTGICAPFFLEAILGAFADQFFTEAMPAAQARLVASTLFGFEHPIFFLIGFGLAFAKELLATRLPRPLGEKAMLLPLGIGMFLGLGLAIPIAMGAAIRQWTDKFQPGHYLTGLLIAAAVMGGEGIAGFGSAALISSGFSDVYSRIIITIIALLVLGTALLRRPKKR